MASPAQLHWALPHEAHRTCPATHGAQGSAPSDLPRAQHPPEHHPLSHPLALSNWQLQLYSWIFFRAHSQPQLSHLPVCQLFPSRSSLTSCECQKSGAYSLPPGQAALLSFAQRDCNLSQALCQQAASQSKHILACQTKPPHPATCSTTLLYPPSLQSCSSSSSLARFKAPSSSLNYLFYTSSKKLLSASSASSCKHLSSSNSQCMYCRVVHLFYPAGSWIFFLLPKLYCDLYPPKCKQPANQSRAHFSHRTNTQAEEQLSTGRQTVNTLGSNKN